MVLTNPRVQSALIAKLGDSSSGKTQIFSLLAFERRCLYKVFFCSKGATQFWFRLYQLKWIADVVAFSYILLFRLSVQNMQCAPNVAFDSSISCHW